MMRQAIVFVSYLMLAFTNAEQSAKKVAPTLQLNNGYKMPVMGLGTFQAAPEDCRRAVKDAIDAGYRHIDTAFLYANEVDVGSAVRTKIDEGVIKREDIFITTKLWSTFHEPDQAEKAFQRSFDNLNMDYIDLYLIHYPVAYQRVLKNTRLPPDDVNAFHEFPTDKEGNTLLTDVDYLETWKAMEKMVESGRIKSIGISNFNSEQIDRLLSIATIKPVTNQVECHPNLNQRKLIAFAAARNITTTCYSPLGSGQKLAISDAKVLEIAKRYGKSPAQILLRYSIQNGAMVIPKSTTKSRIEENINVFDFELSDSDMQTMHTLDNNHRIVFFESDKRSKYYPFNIEF